MRDLAQRSIALGLLLLLGIPILSGCGNDSISPQGGSPGGRGGASGGGGPSGIGAGGSGGATSAGGTGGGGGGASNGGTAGAAGGGTDGGLVDAEPPPSDARDG